MSNVIELEAYRLLGKIMTPEQYNKVVQKAIKIIDNWKYRPMYDTNIVIATAFKSRKAIR